MKQAIRASYILLPLLWGACAAQAGVDTTPNTFAVFLWQDRTTQGNWKGSFGQDGYLIVGESIQVPNYSTFDPHSSVNIHVHDYWSSDPSALQKAHPIYSASERIASYFHSLNTMQIDVSTTDNQPHRIALYLADVDATRRTAIVQAVDTLTGALFDSQSISLPTDNLGQSPIYRNGVYLVYRYQGRITFKIMNATEGLVSYVYSDTYGHPCNFTPMPYPSGPLCAPGNPPTVSLSGIFWGGSAVPASFPAPQISVSRFFTDAIAGVVPVRAWASTPLNYEAWCRGCGIQNVQFMLDGQKIGPEIGSPDPAGIYAYSFAWDTNSVPNGAHILTASARNGQGNTVFSTPSPVTVDNSANVPPPAGTWAKVTGFDTVTSGDWKRFYGRDGHIIAQSSIRPPAYSSVDSRNSTNTLLRNLFSYDLRALLKQFPSYVPYERVESEFSNMTAMEFLVSSNDNQVHRLALYFCDWERLGAKVLVQVLDAASGAVLTASEVSGYANGGYLVMRYRGQVLLRIANLAPAGSNRPAAAVSGFFWGDGGIY